MRKRGRHQNKREKVSGFFWVQFSTWGKEWPGSAIMGPKRQMGGKLGSDYSLTGGKGPARYLGIYEDSLKITGT